MFHMKHIVISGFVSRGTIINPFSEILVLTPSFISTSLFSYFVFHVEHYFTNQFFIRPGENVSCETITITIL